MRRNFMLLLAESPEEAYRIPVAKRAFVKMLPLPRYSALPPPRERKPGKMMSRNAYLKHILQPPKPRWYADLNQTALYSSVLKYTEHQLSDEKLFKLEDYSEIIPAEQKQTHTLKQKLIRADTRVVQPSFKELEPDEKHHNERTSDVDQAVLNMLQELKESPPSLLPHPGLAAYGEALARTFIVEYATDCFPRLHSRHLEDLLMSKTSLSAIVSTGSRIGLCRGLAMEREVRLYMSTVSLAGEKLKYESLIKMRTKNILNGSMTDNLETPKTLLKYTNGKISKLRLSDEQFDLLEERMKLLSRHVYSFIAYSSILNGEDFAKAFVMRYCMPDVLKQELSKNEDMKAWLEINCKWKFTNSDLVPREADRFVEQIENVEAHSGVIAPAVRKMLVTSNPIKELQLVVSNDMTTKGYLDAQPLEYKVLFENFEDVESPDSVELERGVRTIKVGVYAGDLLLGEGSGRTFEDAAHNTAQTILYSYYMNPQKNYLPTPEAASLEESQPKNKGRRKKRVKKNIEKEVQPS